MIPCPSCGRVNDDDARFCSACGATLGAAPPAPPPPPAAPAAPSEVGPSVPARLVGFLRRLVRTNPRALLAVLLVVAFALGIASLGTAWWSYTSTAGGTTRALAFLPGGSYSVMCSGTGCAGFSTGSFPYSAIGGSVGGLYEAVLAAMALSVALTGLAAAIAVLSALGYRTGWWQRSGSFILVFLGLLTALVTIGAVVGAQPGAFAPSTSFAGLGGGSASPLNSFWGSDGAASWGAGAGWYLGLASGLLLIATTVVLVVVGHQRLRVPEPERRTRTAVAPAVLDLRGYTAPPPVAPPPRPAPAAAPVMMTPTRVTPRPSSRTRSDPAPTRAPETPAAEPDAEPATIAPLPVPAAVPTEPRAMIECPACGTPNLARSRTCSYCQRPLRESGS